MLKPAILALIRQVLTVAGTALVAKGYVEASQVEPLIGAMLTIGSVVWSARNMYAAAKQVVELHARKFPHDIESIQALPGVGRSTAAAIAAFAFGQRQAILDGNVKRVFCRLFGIEGWPGEKAVENRLWNLAENLLPGQAINAYTQGLMDLGATVCTPRRPDCPRCPWQDRCAAYAARSRPLAREGGLPPAAVPGDRGGGGARRGRAGADRSTARGGPARRPVGVPPGAVGDEASVDADSFSRGLLDYPHFTPPAEFRGLRVPDVLLSGNHADIRRWRTRESLARTLALRPDLLPSADLDDEEREILRALMDERGPEHGRD